MRPWNCLQAAEEDEDESSEVCNIHFILSFNHTQCAQLCTIQGVTISLRNFIFKPWDNMYIKILMNKSFYASRASKVCKTNPLRPLKLPFIRWYLIMGPTFVQEESDEEEEEAPKPAAKKAKTEEAAEAADDGTVSIFIKNLPWKVDEDGVANFFADCGGITAVRLGEHTAYHLPLLFWLPVSWMWWIQPFLRALCRGLAGRRDPMWKALWVIRCQLPRAEMPFWLTYAHRLQEWTVSLSREVYCTAVK